MKAPELKIDPIESVHNAKLKRIRGLHRRSARESSRLFLLEGSKLVNEALAKGLHLTDIVVSKSFLKEGLGDIDFAGVTQISVVDDKVFRELMTTTNPSGILAVARMPEVRIEDVFRNTNPLVVIADAIQDPGNLGTIVRTALASSSSGVILTRGAADAFSPKVVRAAMGAVFTLPVISDLPADSAIALVKEHGLSVVVADASGKRPFWSTNLCGPVALVFGNEGQGFLPAVTEKADQIVSIPMSDGCESLNVAIAAGIILYEAVRQRGIS